MRDKADNLNSGAAEEFEIHDAGWRIASVEKLQKAERPDPGNRLIFPSAAGLFMVDDLGKAAGLGPLKSSAMIYHRDGLPGAKARFITTRIGSVSMGRGKA